MGEIEGWKWAKVVG